MFGDERGATLLEWAILVSLIAILAIVTVRLVGTDTSSMMGQIAPGFP